MNTQIEALVYVASTSLVELQAGVVELESEDGPTIEARLRNLEAIATTLSGGLDKLSKYMDDLPPDDPNSAQKGPQKPVDDGGLMLRAAQRLAEIVNDG